MREPKCLILRELFFHSDLLVGARFLPQRRVSTKRFFTRHEKIACGVTIASRMLRVAMKLRAYIEHAGITDSAFARAVGISPYSVARICDDLQWPSRDLWRRIESVTDGLVTPNDHTRSDPKETEHGA